jgi:hypothetical protein
MYKLDLKQFHFIYFFLNFFLFTVGVSVNIWVINIFIYLGLLIYTFINSVRFKFPLAEIITVTIFVQNVLAMSILYLYIAEGNGNYINPSYYTVVPIEEYLPFAFLSVQAIYTGFLFIKIPSDIWSRFYLRMSDLISRESLIILMILGFAGTLIINLQISYLNYIGVILNSFFYCALIGFIFIGGRVNRIFIFIGIGLALFQLLSGMFGSSIWIVEYVFFVYLAKQSLAKKKISWLLITLLAFVGIISMAFLQNIKSDYRGATWTGSSEASSETFLKIAQDNKVIKSSTPLEFAFYLSLLTRINQGAIVSETVYKVPREVEFQNGLTIFNSLRDAFVPRFLNPDKEEAGGREKINKYTIRKLNKTTSMNIGLLGEGYINFGKTGCIFFFLLFGVFVAFFEKFILNVSLRNPIILILFPIYFQIFNSSESDFMMLFNGLLKTTIFILIILSFLRYKEYQKGGFSNSKL